MGGNRARAAGDDSRPAPAVLGRTLLEVSTGRTGGGGEDRGTKRVLVGSLTVAVLVGWWLAPRGPALPGAGWPDVLVGTALIAAGGGLRVWAVATLGRYFRRDVTIQTGHRVVTSGPYRLVRHPAYTGNLLAAVGFGVALGSWASLLAITAIAVAGHLPRIAVEERAMHQQLGDDWDSYARGRPRLVPGLY